MSSCLVILATGFESVEAIAPIDILCRAGVEVTVAGLNGREIVSAQGLKVVTDIELEQGLGLYDMIFLPGGMPGSVNLAESPVVIDILKRHNAEERFIAAICAAPAKVLAPNGILDGKNATCYPQNMDELAGAASGVVLSEEKVVVSGHVITSRGVGTALELGFVLAECLCGSEVAEKLRVATVAK